MREDYAAKRPSPLVSASRCGTFHTVSDAGWTYVGIAVAVAFVVAGLVTMLVLLRQRHVARIEAEATAAPVPAA